MTTTLPDSIAIRMATPEDLTALRSLPFSAGLPEKHADRLARQQRDEVAYLLAIDRATEVIIGHLLLKWNSPESQAVRELVPACAEIEDFTIERSRQNQGIGSAMLEAAAAHCRNRGVQRLGLAVGVGNPAAHRLYERRGFREVPGSLHRVSWLAPDGHGGSREDHEDCVYLLRDLSGE